MHDRWLPCMWSALDARGMTTTSASAAWTEGTHRFRLLLPGIAIAVAGALFGLVVNQLLPVVSPLLVSIVFGAAVANLHSLPETTAPGLAWSGRRLLRAGIVLLGLQLSLTQVAGLGAATIALVVAVVLFGIAGTLWLGRLLGLPWSQRLLIACGFSICGAAAVAAVDGATETDEEEVATAVALVVLYGSLMIGVVPLIVSVARLDERTGGIWAGASTHEVAQVVAAAGLVGEGALSVAVVVKLARVLMLAPVLAWVGWQHRRSLPTTADESSSSKPPPLMPVFVLGFCVLVAVNTWVPLPDWLLGTAKGVETVLLATAMCALGCGVRIGFMRRVGIRPVVLGALSTTLVAVIGLAGALIVS